MEKEPTRLGSSKCLYFQERTHSGVSVWKYDDINNLEEEIQKDTKLSSIMQQIIANNPPAGFSIRNGCLLCVSKSSSKIHLILKKFHITSMGGQLGYLRTYKRAASFVYWEGMRMNVQNFVAKCVILVILSCLS